MTSQVSRSGSDFADNRYRLIGRSSSGLIRQLRLLQAVEQIADILVDGNRPTGQQLVIRESAGAQGNRANAALRRRNRVVGCVADGDRPVGRFGGSLLQRACKD